MNVKPELPLRDKKNKRKNEYVSLNEDEKEIVLSNANKYRMKLGVYLREVAYNPVKFVNPSEQQKSSTPAANGKCIKKKSFIEIVVSVIKEINAHVGATILFTRTTDTLRFEANDFVLTYQRKGSLLRGKKKLD